jgi:hypothetical protein
MANGELRFRLMANDGSGYIRTIAPATGAWQNSHYHQAVLETYIVQRGWIGFVELISGEAVWAVITAGEVYTTRPHIPHNVYMPANAILHTVKHGEVAGQPDWYESADLDAVTKTVTEAEVIQRGKHSQH